MKLHPLTRIAVVALFSAAALAYSGSLILLLLLGVCLLLNLLSSGQQLRNLLKASAKLLPVALGVFIIQLVFSSKGKDIADFYLFSITDKGLAIAISVVLRLLILLYSAIWLSRLSAGEFYQAFRAIRLPDTFAVMLSMTLRFLPEMLARLKQVSFQLRTRGIGLSRWNLTGRITLFRMLALSILGWTLKDLQYRAVALDYRGFRNGVKHTVYVHTRMKLSDYAIIALAIVAVCLPGILF
jgi:energy-coupling factor transport system permease protein